MAENKNDKAWSKIFSKYDILQKINNGEPYEISSSQINEFREARLMTKFDFSSQLPQIFRENSLSLLPITRGSYLIGDFNIFAKFEEPQQDIPILYAPFPHHIESLNYNNVNSEAIAINCAYISKILKEFSQEDNLLPTVTGRMGSSDFSYYIKNNCGFLSEINVHNAQIEIDGGFEGDNSLLLIEAKNILAEDFVIRQLYYPYRSLTQRIQKPVRPVFLTYSNGIFHLREYKFSNIDIYNSIELINYKKYSIIDETISFDLLRKLSLNNRYIEESYNIPFPQADSFERIINLCELLNKNGTKDKEAIIKEYGFVSRQADYYCNAGIYLGLIEKTKINSNPAFKLSAEGKKLFMLPLFERQIALIKTIIRHQPFGEALSFYVNQGLLPSKELVINFMINTPKINVKSCETMNRRAQTVMAWVKWITDLLRESDNGTTIF